ncbi:MAG: O-antigen ligase family protein [Cyclobacteriaceae bacterium]|nr:MAG: O-antigen ligase family protein [Cyclobacteriaceae bacterium]
MAREVIWLSILITSYFYCLPLGRFSLGNFLTDFRIFDFAIIAFWLFNWKYLSGRVGFIYRQKKFSPSVLKILIIIVLVSIIFNITYRGLGYLGPTLIRAFRFVAYLSTLVAVIAIVSDRKRFKFIFYVFFFNILLQATLAFFQSIGALEHFWPLYWREMYAFNDAPVATLSPHHKHIGVVMLMGLALSLAMVQFSRNVFNRIFYSIAALLTLLIPLFSGTRTFLLGVAGLVLGLLYMTKTRFIPLIIFLSIGFFIAFVNLSDEIKDAAVGRITEKYEDRIVREYEVGGIAELASERTIIYESIFRAISDFPLLLVTGAGFQAGTVFVFGNGAHNNFLQFLLETGLIGLFFFLSFLYRTSGNLMEARSKLPYRFERTIAEFSWIGFVGLFFTMFVGETLYAQPSMFTLAGQIMIFLGLGLAPYFWQTIRVNGVPVYR